MLKLIITSLLLFALSGETKAGSAWISVQSSSFVKSFKDTPVDFQTWFNKQSSEFKDITVLRSVADLKWLSSLSVSQRNTSASLPGDNLIFLMSFDVGVRSDFIKSISPVLFIRHLKVFLSELDDCIVRGGCAPYRLCKKDWKNSICKQQTNKIAQDVKDCMNLFGECKIRGYLRSK